MWGSSSKSKDTSSSRLADGDEGATPVKFDEDQEICDQTEEPTQEELAAMDMADETLKIKDDLLIMLGREIKATEVGAMSLILPRFTRMGHEHYLVIQLICVHSFICRLLLLALTL